MKPRSSLTLSTPTDANVNRRKNSKFQLPDSISFDVRRSVEQCLADLNTGYRSTLHAGGLKKTVINQGNKRKSIVRMAARRKEQRSEYLNSKRQGDEGPHIQEVQTPSSTTVEIETLAAEGASSLDSLRRLVTERKEYLEMSQHRKQKVQWYERVTRQSEQLLNFLRANDRSAGDTFVNNAANLVLAYAPASAESRRLEPPALSHPANSGVRSTRPGLTTPVRTITGTTTEGLQNTTKKESNRAQNGTAPRKFARKRGRAPGTSNIANGQRKPNIHMAKPTGYDGVARQDDINRGLGPTGAPSSSAGRMFKKIQEARLALTAHISGNAQTESETGPSKRKRPENTGGDDKENVELRGPNLANDSKVFHRTSAGALNNGFRKDGPHFNRMPGTTARQNLNPFNNNNTINNYNNVGFHGIEQNGSGPNRKIPGVHPSNQTCSSIKRKRVSFNGSWANNTKTGAEARWTGAEAMDPVAEVIDSSAEAMGPATEVRTPSPEDSLWVTLRKMWKKPERGVGPEMRPEGEAEALSRASSTEDDPTKGGGTNPYKMLPRARAGRTIKRRRREAKSPPVLTSDDEADYAFGPHADPSTCGPQPGRPFIIPDRPYEVEEALSMDLMNTAYDFIHNG